MKLVWTQGVPLRNPSFQWVARRETHCEPIDSEIMSARVFFRNPCSHSLSSRTCMIFCLPTRASISIIERLSKLINSLIHDEWLRMNIRTGRKKKQKNKKRRIEIPTRISVNGLIWVFVSDLVGSPNFVLSILGCWGFDVSKNRLNAKHIIAKKKEGGPSNSGGAWKAKMMKKPPKKRKKIAKNR